MQVPGVCPIIFSINMMVEWEIDLLNARHICFSKKMEISVPYKHDTRGYTPCIPMLEVSPDFNLADHVPPCFHINPVAQYETISSLYSGRQGAGVPQVLSVEHVLQVDSDSDSDHTDNGICTDLTSIGTHCLFQHLRSNVHKLEDTLQSDHKVRLPIHETLYVDKFRRPHTYPIPNNHKTFWTDGDTSIPVRSFHVLFAAKSKCNPRPKHIRTMVEICTKTMNLSIRAGKSNCWKAFPPITI